MIYIYTYTLYMYIILYMLYRIDDMSDHTQVVPYLQGAMLRIRQSARAARSEKHPSDEACTRGESIQNG